MKQFIETPEGELINLKNVSNIVFMPDNTTRQGQHKPKIIFNFDYHVTLPKSDKKISDYKYLIFDTIQEYKSVEKELEKLINEKEWIAPIIDGKIEKIINPDKISFVTQDDNKLRIIVNLSSSVSFHGNYFRYTSDFVYLNHTDPEEYERNLSYIRGLLKLREF
jgi:hypothetical protein